MTKDEAIQRFFAYNNIEYAPSHSYDDPRLESLTDNVSIWLNSIEEEDHDLFLRMLSCYNYLTNAEAVRRYKDAVELLQKSLSEQFIHISVSCL